MRRMSNSKISTSNRRRNTHMNSLKMNMTTINQGRKDTHMKAIVYTHYGPPDVLKLEEVEKLTPQDDEVLVQVQAASVNAADLHFLRGKPFLFRLVSGVLKPKNTILGSDIAGRVEAV